MKNAISNVWLIGIVFTFILLFSGYLAITINYSRAFKIKNEVLTIIEKHNGLTDNMGSSVPSKFHSGSTVIGNLGGLQSIALYMAGSAYNVMSTCPNDGSWYGVESIDYTKTKLKPVNKGDNSKYYYCVKKEMVGDTVGNGTAFKSAAFYKIKIFYKMNLPVIGDIIKFTIDGTSSEVTVPQDEKTFS